MRIARCGHRRREKACFGLSAAARGRTHAASRRCQTTILAKSPKPSACVLESQATASTMTLAVCVRLSSRVASRLGSPGRKAHGRRGSRLLHEHSLHSQHGCCMHIRCQHGQHGSQHAQHGHDMAIAPTRLLCTVLRAQSSARCMW